MCLCSPGAQGLIVAGSTKFDQFNVLPGVRVLFGTGMQQSFKALQLVEKKSTFFWNLRQQSCKVKADVTGKHWSSFQFSANSLLIKEGKKNSS